MKLNTIAASVIAMAFCMPQAMAADKKVTIEEFTQIMGDFLALDTICPELEEREGAFEAFMAVNGITSYILHEEDGYLSDIQSWKKASLQARKTKSVEDNCADALRLYGDDGAVVAGMLQSK